MALPALWGWWLCGLGLFVPAVFMVFKRMCDRRGDYKMDY
ncbi:unnamed protein product [Fusarium venenatum]|uniref:Uncharacterized protein n=1 Tax=Fusarium venenatum TaxID=56646 RepID=A0A2L2U0Q3_9HYPO|nr:uncharacterized protein FVRRES_08667 [Fusarium venenatum]CEI68590.1 unnamed protein product [Fusarium venenatum]